MVRILKNSKQNFNIDSLIFERESTLSIKFIVHIIKNRIFV
jgi:hypothetical protein